MKKIVTIIGSYRKGATYNAVCELGNILASREDVDFEIVFLQDYRLAFCRGCKLCFEKGEENCPLHDDRDLLLQKIESADGIILATPNYSFQVSATVKNMLDRFAFIYHRPSLFGKAFMPIVTQGIYGGRAIVKYLDFIGKNFGFDTIKGCVLKTLDPMTEQTRQKNSALIQKAAKRFERMVDRSTPLRPSLFQLMIFRMSRTSVKSMLNEEFRDFNYYREKGWFQSDYYFETALSPVKRAMGLLFDRLSRSIVR